MSERGVFAVDRGIWDHPIFKNERFTQREAWMWLIGAAAYKRTRVRVGRATVELDRGQLAFSTRFLAKRWRWTDSAVRRFFATLKSDAMIDTEATHEATRITICNYNEHQFSRRTDVEESDAQTDALATHSRRKQEEGKEREEVKKKEKRERPRAKARTPLPEDWTLSDKGRAYARQRGFDLPKIEAMVEAFRNHHVSRGSLMADWEAAWRTWVENEIKFTANRIIPLRAPPSRGPSMHELARELGTDDEPASQPYDLDLRANSAY